VLSAICTEVEHQFQHCRSGRSGEHSAPHYEVAMIARLLAAKAEIVLGALLVIRHRTPRLTALLVLAVVASGFLTRGGSGSPANSPWVVFVVAGSLVAVSASRLLAPGAALAAGYRVAASWWLVPSARLVGALFVTFPLVAGAALVLGQPVGAGFSAGELISVTGLYAATLAALVLALTPAVGASAAAAIGFMAAWFGMLPPSAVSNAFERWPIVQRALVLAWNSLPLGWRATRWLERGTHGDGFLLFGWLLVGLATAAWAITWALRSRNQKPGGAV